MQNFIFCLDSLTVLSRERAPVHGRSSLQVCQRGGRVAAFRCLLYGKAGRASLGTRLGVGDLLMTRHVYSDSLPSKLTTVQVQLNHQWCRGRVLIATKLRTTSGGLARTPFLASKRLYIQCLTIGKWSTSSLAAIEKHRCPSKSGCSYAGLFLEGQPRTARVNGHAAAMES